MKKENRLTKEELNFAIYEFEFSLDGVYCNGNWEEFDERSDLSKRSFENQVGIVKSIIKKLKEEKKIINKNKGGINMGKKKPVKKPKKK